MYNFCLLVYAKGEGQTPQINVAFLHYNMGIMPYVFNRKPFFWLFKF